MRSVPTQSRSTVSDEGAWDQSFADLPADMIEVEKGLASQNFLDFRIHSQIRFREVGTEPAFSSIVAFPEDESLRSLLFSLTGDGLHHLPDLLRIAEEIVAHEVQPAIELENVGTAVGKFKRTISPSETCLRCLTIPRRLLP